MWHQDIDVNADGHCRLGTDGMIYLTGLTTGVVISDVVFDQAAQPQQG